jgi:hypothetical protein
MVSETHSTFTCRTLFRETIRRALSAYRGLARLRDSLLVRFPGSLFPRLFRRPSIRWRRQFDSCAPGLGKADSDRLLGRPCSVLALANTHFFPNEFPCLSRGRFALSRVASSPFNCSFCWHGIYRARWAPNKGKEKHINVVGFSFRICFGIVRAAPSSVPDRSWLDSRQV